VNKTLFMSVYGPRVLALRREVKRAIQIPLMGQEKHWRRLHWGFCSLLGVDAPLTSEEQLSLPDRDTKPRSTEASPGQSRSFGMVRLRWWRCHLVVGWA